MTTLAAGSTPSAPPRRGGFSFAGVEPPEPTLGQWIAFTAMIFGNFMAILDIQIVASSITQIQAGVSASRDEITWVQTSYLIAEVIAIPLSGFLIRALGTRLLFTVAASAFAVLSMACALSWDMNSLIVFRTLQGFVGGALIPTTMSTLYLTFPSHRQAVAGTMVGLVSTMAPSIGPTLGGWISEAAGWRWLFWVNVVPGIIIAVLVWRLQKGPKPNWAMIRNLDVWGLLGLAAMLGCTQFVLEEGPGHDWFAETGVAIAAAAALLGTIIFFYRSLTHPNPVVDLRVFRYGSFGIGCALAILVGVGLYTPTFLQPLFLGQVRGYNALEIGHNMFAQGLTMFIMAPIMSRLAQYAEDPRPLAAFGFICIAISCFMQSHLTAESAFWDFFFPQAIRGVGLMTTFMAVMRPTLASLPPELVPSGTGVFNLMRNLGGAFGLATLITLQQHALAGHRQELYAAANTPTVRAMLEGSAARLAAEGVQDPETVALANYLHLLDREALVMTFNDQFLTVALALCVAAGLVLLMRKPKPGQAAPADAH
ncbi:MAG: DHA2 family efflux MFS transporter permease subunit [Alphaproteobacteria bacterium]|nr:DHA2 family efflux MFS transporter permease subunit [Alphaproteobacteria bacterium]